MENASSSGLIRTKSDQLVEKVAAAFKSPTISGDTGGGSSESGGGGPSRKSSKRLMTATASPGRSSTGGSSKNAHIRKSRSAQITRYDLDEVSSGAALSRASSASLGLSFSFTGFTVPPDEIADSKPFSDEDTPEDLEAGNAKPKFQAEPTLPIYLKARMENYLATNGP